ncbi:MAG: hypothetical protein L3J88_05615 [Gammaproteobacteria bacterium]|nr:hypothetical protein [Gammaproteobacteria bacterium]MCF6362813.1 hypothetical protein [Gammaproteobacteria bacterium]
MLLWNDWGRALYSKTAGLHTNREGSAYSIIREEKLHIQLPHSERNLAINELINLDDGRKLGFVDAGESTGLPIFLFHGTPGSRIFGFEDESLVKNLWLKKEGLRIITPERPGYGLSDSSKKRKIRAFHIPLSGRHSEAGI